MVKNVPDYQKCQAIGLGIPGPVDKIVGTITMATNLKGFKNFPVEETLSQALGLEVILDNDANVAGLAEARFGAGKKSESVYYITHSTGIGGAYISGGKVISGFNGFAGEIGNIVVSDSQDKINHLNLGAVENEISGTALIKRSKILVDKEITSAQELFYFAEEGNEKALRLVDDMAKKLALMMANIAHVIAPHIFVLGGGVTKSHHLYLHLVKKYFKEYVHEGMSEIKIELAQLNEPGVIGAAMLAQSRI